VNASSNLLRRQRGLSLFGMLFFGIVLVVIVVIGMRVMPTALEFYACKRAIAKVAASGETGVFELQRAFDKIAAVEDIATITGKDLKIQRDGGVVTISFQYEKRIPLVGPASLVLDYEGTSTGRPQ